MPPRRRSPSHPQSTSPLTTHLTRGTEKYILTSLLTKSNAREELSADEFDVLIFLLAREIRGHGVVSDAGFESEDVRGDVGDGADGADEGENEDDVGGEDYFVVGEVEDDDDDDEGETDDREDDGETTVQPVRQNRHSPHISERNDFGRIQSMSAVIEGEDVQQHHCHYHQRPSALPPRNQARLQPQSQLPTHSPTHSFNSWATISSFNSYNSHNPNPFPYYTHSDLFTNLPSSYDRPEDFPRAAHLFDITSTSTSTSTSNGVGGARFRNPFTEPRRQHRDLDVGGPARHFNPDVEGVRFGNPFVASDANWVVGDDHVSSPLSQGELGEAISGLRSFWSSSSSGDDDNDDGDDDDEKEEGNANDNEGGSPDEATLQQWLHRIPAPSFTSTSSSLYTPSPSPSPNQHEQETPDEFLARLRATLDFDISEPAQPSEEGGDNSEVGASNNANPLDWVDPTSVSEYSDCESITAFLERVHAKLDLPALSELSGQAGQAGQSEQSHPPEAPEPSRHPEQSNPTHQATATATATEREESLRSFLHRMSARVFAEVGVVIPVDGYLEARANANAEGTDDDGADAETEERGHDGDGDGDGAEAEVEVDGERQSVDIANEGSSLADAIPADESSTRELIEGISEVVNRTQGILPPASSGSSEEQEKESEKESEQDDDESEDQDQDATEAFANFDGTHYDPAIFEPVLHQHNRTLAWLHNIPSPPHRSTTGEFEFDRAWASISDNSAGVSGTDVFRF